MTVTIDAALVRRLVAAQFPAWADLPIAKVEPGGWDNRTFQLGEHMSVRLPSAAPYALQVAKEQRWLPELAPLLPLSIPVPLALGQPGEGYPWHWSVYRWLPGERATRARIADLRQLAVELGAFLVALQRIDAGSGPPPGAHCFGRGGTLRVYDAETRRALAALDGAIDAAAAAAVWAAALAAPWREPPVWFHGDVSSGNLLLQDGRLSAVIDFGCCGVGDPACDLSIAWTLFAGESRHAFRAAVSLDDSTWARARGWTLWKALIVRAGLGGASRRQGEKAQRVLEELLAEHARAT